MLNTSYAPFLRIMGVFVLGILAHYYYPASFDFFASWQFIVSISSILFLCWIFLPQSYIYQYRNSIGILFLLFVFALGINRSKFYSEYQYENHFTHHNTKIKHYKAVVYSQPEYKNGKVRCRLRMLAHQDSTNQWKNSIGTIQVFFEKDDSLSKSLHYGDILYVKGHPQPTSPPANPHQFDYKTYLAHQNIFHTHFIRSHSYLAIGKEIPSKVIKYAFTIRHFLDAIFKKYIHSHQEYAVVTAMFLGVRDGIDEEMMQAYSATGAMHILSVSGLHVGILMAILSFFLAYVCRISPKSSLFFWIALLTLWGYAFITGLSASVLRSVVMFSFVLLGQYWNQKSNLYNNLAISALLLLFYNPLFLFDVGFLLSYGAVAGIAFWYKVFHAAVDIEAFFPAVKKTDTTSTYWQIYIAKWFAQKFWETICVSLAAQLATFPLAMYYFHQFPNYFLLTNILILFPSTLILIFSVVLIALSWIPFLNVGVGFILKYTVLWTNEIIFWVEQLPFAAITDIYVSALDAFFIYGILIMVTLFWLRKKVFLLWLSTVLCVALFGSMLLHHLSTQKQDTILVYSIAQHQNVVFKKGNEIVFFGDSMLIKDTKKIQFPCQNDFIVSGIKRKKFIALDNSPHVQKTKFGKVLVYSQKRIFFIENKMYKPLPAMQCDILIISKNAIQDIQFLENVQYKKLIFDASCSLWKVEKFKKQLPSSHHILIDGALEIDVLAL